MHGRDEDDALKCGMLNPLGAQNALAFMYAISEINNNADLALRPDVKLGTSHHPLNPNVKCCIKHSETEHFLTCVITWALAQVFLVVRQVWLDSGISCSVLVCQKHLQK